MLLIASRYFAIFCFVAILATSMFNMAICFYNALVSMGGLMVPSTTSPPHPEPGPAQAYVANPIPVEESAVLADSAISVSTHRPSTHTKSLTALEPLSLDQPDDYETEQYFEDRLNIEFLVTQSVLGLNPFLLILFSPLFLLLLLTSHPPTSPQGNRALNNPRVPMPGFAPVAEAVGHPTRTLESLLQDPIFNSDQPFLKPI